MMNDKFQIGEISKLFNINVRTLRYYDQIGLLQPGWTDSQTGYRYYYTEQFEQLNTIKYLRALGLSIADIKSHLKNRDIKHILSLLRKQKKETQRKMDELMCIQKKLDTRIRQLEDVSSMQQLGKVREQVFPARTIIMLRHKICEGDNLELPIRQLENQAQLQSSIFLGKIGLSICAENLRRGIFNEYSSIFSVAEGQESASEMAYILRAGTYAVLRFQGSHQDAAPQYRILMDYLAQKGCTVTEDSVEITLVDYGLTADPSKFVTEIQLLMK